MAEVLPSQPREWMLAWQAMSTSRKMLVRLALMLAVLVFVGMVAAAPAWAGPTALPAKDGLALSAQTEWSKDLSHYLIVSRWSPVTFSPSGDLGLGSIIAHAPYMIQVVLLSITTFFLRAYMGLLGLTSGGEIITNAAWRIDEVFARIGNGISGNDGGSLLSGQGMAIITVCLLILTGLSIWRYLAGGGFRVAARTMLGGLGALLLLLIMSSAAASNGSVQGSVSAANTQQQLNYANSGGAIGSPRWFITKGNSASAWLGDQTQKVFTAMTDSLDGGGASTSGGYDECEVYIQGIHDIYLEGAAAKSEASGHVMVAFDSLITEVFFQNIRIASLGGESDSSNSSWCRYSEMEAGVPVEDQVRVARRAGLYSDIVGFDPANAVVSGGSRVSGSAMTASGNWTQSAGDDQPGGAELAAQIFGPAFASGDTSSRAQYYWAACQWDTPGGNVKMNPAWKDVRASAASGESFQEAIDGNTGWGWLGPLAWVGAALSDWLNDDDIPLLGQSAVNPCTHIASAGLLDNAQHGGRMFQYGESYFLQDTLRFWNLSNLDFFAKPLAAGDREAYDFYRSTQGLDTSRGFIGSIAAITATSIFMWFSVPTAFGLLFAQLAGLVAWVLLPLALLFVIVPVAKTKRFAMISLRTIVYSMFAAVVFTIVLQLAQFVYKLLNIMLITEGSNDVGRWLLTTLTAVIAFAVIKMIVKQIFTNDITTIRGAVKQSQQIANRPLLKDQGRAEPDMGFRRPNFLQRAGSHALGNAINDGNNRLRSSLLDRFGKKPEGSSAEEALLKSKDKAKAETKEKVSAGVGGEKPEWRKAAGAAVAGAAAGKGVGSAGGSKPPAGPQARGEWGADKKAGNFIIPKDGTIAATGGFPEESKVLANSVSEDEHKKMSAQDKKAYMFDPVSGRFVPKLNVDGMGAESIDEDIVAPISTLLNKEAPEGVSQEDWDKTALMRAEMARSGLLGPATPERKSLVEEVAKTAREQAAATGAVVPPAPAAGSLERQAPGVESAPASASGRMTLERHPDGTPKVVIEGATEAGRLTRTRMREDGTVETRTFEREGQKVHRAYDSAGTVMSEWWEDSAGNLHRDDGPSRTEYASDGTVAKQEWSQGGQLSRMGGPAVVRTAPDGSVIGQEWYLAGQQLSEESFRAAVEAAQAAVGSASARAAIQNAAVEASSRGGSGLGVSLDSKALQDAVAGGIEQARAAGTLDKDGLDHNSIAAAVSMSSAMAVQQAIQESQFPTGDHESLAAAALEHVGAMSQSRQEAVAQQAARAILDDTQRYATATNASPEQVAAAANAVLSGQFNPQMAETLARMVHESGQSSPAAEQMRLAMVEGAREAGLMERPARAAFDDATARQQVAAVPVLTNLDAAQQQALAEEAARLVAASPTHFASASNMAAESLLKTVESVASGGATYAQHEQIADLVRRHGEGREAAQLRAVMESLSPAGSAMGSIDTEMDAVTAHLSRIADEHRDARTAAIRDRVTREIQGARESAQAEIKAINSALTEAAQAQMGPGVSEEQFNAQMAALQRDAFVRKTQIEERLAAKMGAALDNAGVELSNASVSDHDLSPLRQSRESVLSDFKKVQGIRGWFHH